MIRTISTANASTTTAAMPRKFANPCSADDLRRTFDSAIAQIHSCGVSASWTTAPGEIAAEKRAVTDAARALARLWNVSPTMLR